MRFLPAAQINHADTLGYADFSFDDTDKGLFRF